MTSQTVVQGPGATGGSGVNGVKLVTGGGNGGAGGVPFNIAFGPAQSKIKRLRHFPVEAFIQRTTAML